MQYEGFQSDNDVKLTDKTYLKNNRTLPSKNILIGAAVILTLIFVFAVIYIFQKTHSENINKGLASNKKPMQQIQPSPTIGISNKPTVLPENHVAEKNANDKSPNNIITATPTVTGNPVSPVSSSDVSKETFGKIIISSKPVVTVITSKSSNTGSSDSSGKSAGSGSSNSSGQSSNTGFSNSSGSNKSSGNNGFSGGPNVSVLPTTPGGSNTTNPTSTPGGLPSPVPTADTRDWNTYSNPTFGYTLRYPTDWFVKNTTLIGNTQSTNFGINNNPDEIIATFYIKASSDRLDVNQLNLYKTSIYITKKGQTYTYQCVHILDETIMQACDTMVNMITFNE